MPTSSAERRRLLKQALTGFAQRHPDYDISGIELHLADAIGLTIASIKKWRTGYPISEKHVPSLAEWAVRQAGMDRAWLRSFLHHCGQADSDLEDRLCGASDQPHRSVLREAVHASNLRLWGRERLESAASLYCPRPAVLNLIERILESDRPGLILVGASGLGKTSLALWLTTIQSRLALPVMVYPAVILDGSKSLADLLIDALYPRTSSTGDPLTWPILAIFDGVNESPEMLRLAWQIDRALVNAAGPKIIMTFRPESFQIARHSLALNEHCYFTGPVDAATTPEASTRPAFIYDPPAVQLQPFTPDELPAVYDLYRRAHGLQTTFTGIPASLREVLRYPLNMRLVAETYTGAFLPDQLDSAQLIQRLLEAFVVNGRLQRSDIHFLEDNLMPLMISPGHWGNTITAEQIEVARTADGLRLITRGELGPLTRLADAGLLASTGGRLDEPIRFAHERFYEHFVGQRLQRLRSEAADAHAFYDDVAAGPIFVFSPARRLLVEEIAQQPLAWLIDWMTGGDLPERDRLLISALEDWGKANPQKAHVWLERLWRISQTRSAKWLTRIGLPAPEPAPEALRLQRVVVAVAGALRDHDMLIRVLLGSGPTVQSAAVAQAMHLWRADPEIGKAVISQVGDHITGRLGLPNWTAGFAFLQLVGFVLFERGQHAEVQSFLRVQGQAAIHRIFGKFWRTLLLRTAIDWLVGAAERAVRDAAFDSTLEAGFHLSPEQCQHLEALVPFVDWEVPGFSSPAIYEHIRAVLRIGAQESDWVLNILFIQRGLVNPSEVNAVILALLRESCETQSTPPWIVRVVGFAIEVNRRRPHMEPVLWTLVDSSVSRIVGDYPTWHERYRRSRINPPQRLLSSGDSVGPYLMARYAAQLPLEEGPVWAIIAGKIESGDATFIRDYIRELRLVAMDCNQPRLALRLIQPVLRRADKSLWLDIADLLAHIKLVTAEDVRELLISPMIQPELAALAEAWQTKDRTNERLYFTPWDWFHQFSIESRSIRRLMVEIFGQMMHSPDMRSWALWTAKRVLNALTNEEIFT